MARTLVRLKFRGLTVTLVKKASFSTKLPGCQWICKHLATLWSIWQWQQHLWQLQLRPGALGCGSSGSNLRHTAPAPAPTTCPMPEQELISLCAPCYSGSFSSGSSLGHWVGEGGKRCHGRLPITCWQPSTHFALSCPPALVESQFTVTKCHRFL